MESQWTLNRQNNLEKEEKSWRTQTFNFKICYKAKVIKTVWYWHKDRHIDQWNRIESPEKKLLHIWSNYFWQGFWDHSMGKGQKMMLSKLDIHIKIMKLDLYLTQKITKDLKASNKTIKLLEENIGGILWH